LALFVVVVVLSHELVDKVVHLWVLLEVADEDLSCTRSWQWNAAGHLGVDGVLLRLAGGLSGSDVSRLCPVLELVQTFLPSIKAFECRTVKAVSQQLGLDSHV